MRLLPPARVIEEISRVGLTPVLQHTQQGSIRQIFSNLLFGYIGETDAIECAANDQFDIIDDQRTAHSDRQTLLPLLKFPPIQASRTVTEIDAAMLQEITRQLRPRV